jgi:hypothetical protein
MPSLEFLYYLSEAKFSQTIRPAITNVNELTLPARAIDGRSRVAMNPDDHQRRRRRGPLKWDLSL